MEILQGIERRRRWSVEDKARIVAEATGPGAVFAAVVRRHGISPSLLWGWPRDARARKGDDGCGTAFLPVRVVEESPAQVTPEREHIAAGSRLEIRLANGTVVRAEGATDAVLLAAAIPAVR
jgi:transposase